MSDAKAGIGLDIGATGVESTRRDIASIYRELRDGRSDVQAANSELRTLTESVRVQNRAVVALRRDWRVQHATFLEGMRAMRSVAGIGRTLTSVYQTHTLAQIRIADATRDVRDTETELAAIQARREKVVRDLGATSTYAQRIMKEEGRIQKILTEEKKDLSRAQKENIVGYASMGLSMLDVVARTSDIIRSYKTMKDLVGDKGFKATAIEGITASAAAAKGAIAGIGTAWGALTLAPIAATVIITPALAAPFLSTDEQKMRALTNVQDKQNWASGILTGTVPAGPGAPGMEDWIDGLVEDVLGSTGQVGQTIGGTNPWGGGDINVNVEDGGGDIDVDVDITVKHGGGDRHLR